MNAAVLIPEGNLELVGQEWRGRFRAPSARASCEKAGKNKSEAALGKPPSRARICRPLNQTAESLFVAATGTGTTSGSCGGRRGSRAGLSSHARITELVEHDRNLVFRLLAQGGQLVTQLSAQLLQLGKDGCALGIGCGLQLAHQRGTVLLELSNQGLHIRRKLRCRDARRANRRLDWRQNVWRPVGEHGRWCIRPDGRRAIRANDRRQVRPIGGRRIGPITVRWHVRPGRRRRIGQVRRWRRNVG